FLITLTLLMSLSFILVACGGSNGNNANEGNNNAGNEKSSDDFSVAMVTDTGGVDDKSFNQSAWEGLQAWGEEHGLDKSSDCYDYAQSEDDSDYLPNFSRLVKNDFDVVFGVCFLLEDAVEEIAAQNPDNQFPIVDTSAKGVNVASLPYAEHEGSF